VCRLRKSSPPTPQPPNPNPPTPQPQKHHQANFTSLEALITRIHKDADEARRALGAAPLSRLMH